MSTLPTRIYASVTVPNTPLITSALAFSKTHSTPTLHNHMIRSWLFGTIIADKLPTLQSRDREAHSLATILHDTGFDPTGALISDDKCFEVDGANAAVAFLEKEAKETYDQHRRQLVWDAIALHTAIHIAMHKEAEVVATAMGIAADLMGPEAPMTMGLLTWEEYEGVVMEVPRLCLKTEKWGEKYVQGFAPVKVIERLEEGIERLG